MNTSRREFVQLSALAAASLGLSPFTGATMVARRAPKSILILGGTAFLGPACMDAALARGHKVSLFNRGRIEQKRKEASRPLDIPAGVEVLYGNRDPKKNADDWKDETKDGPKNPDAPKGLSQLEGKSWDAVIDTSGFFPRMVAASAELLAPKVKQYVFISSISAYKKNDTPNADETAETATLSDPTVEEFGADFSNYGGAKVLCEKAAEKAMPGRVANVRPGYIVGPKDSSGRFIYWPLRVERGGEMLVPGKPTDPIQIIDVRDLAEWIITLIENNTNGVFNATGPAKELSMREMLEGCKKATGANTTFTWADPATLKAKGVQDGEFPLWLPPEGETAGFHRVSIAKAIAAGLKFRSVEDTAKATLAWYKTVPADLQKRIAPQSMTAEREAKILAEIKGG